MYKANSIQEESAREMTVLAVHPLKRPEIVTIRNELSVLQDAVGGMIQVVYPFQDVIGLIMNEEGKLMGLPLNRALRTEDGEIYDIVAGTFLVVGLTEDDFCSLSSELQEKYSRLFQTPEMFMRIGHQIVAVPAL